jgi:hypothetical protein
MMMVTMPFLHHPQLMSTSVALPFPIRPHPHPLVVPVAVPQSQMSVMVVSPRRHPLVVAVSPVVEAETMILALDSYDS